MATNTFVAGQPGIGAADSGIFPVRRPQAVINALSTETNGVNIGDADINQMLAVLPNDFVAIVCLEVMVSEAGAATVDVGDGAVNDRYINAADVNVTAGNSYVSAHIYSVDSTNADLELPDTLAAGISGLVGGFHYDSADTIDIVANAALDATKLRLTALIFSMDGDQTVGNLETT